MTNLYNAGSAVRLTASFVDLTNNPADPGTITLKTKDPVGGITSYVFGSSAMVKDSVGNYHMDIQIPDVTLNVAGTWYYRWEGSGTITATFEGEFIVSPSKIV